MRVCFENLEASFGFVVSESRAVLEFELALHTRRVKRVRMCTKLMKVELVLDAHRVKRAYT